LEVFPAWLLKATVRSTERDPDVLNLRDTKTLVKQFFCFAGIGLFGTLAHYLTLALMVEVVGVKAVFASVLGFGVGALFNYFFNYHITFKSEKLHQEALVKFFMVALVGLFLNTLIMAVATEFFSIYYLLAQVISTGLVLFWNFTGNRLWTFQEARNGR
jgi:putative flippase GtrA